LTRVFHDALASEGDLFRRQPFPFLPLLGEAAQDRSVRTVETDVVSVASVFRSLLIGGLSGVDGKNASYNRCVPCSEHLLNRLFGVGHRRDSLLR
jgi:hypothetical protein